MLKKMLQWVRRTLLVVFLSVLVVSAGHGEVAPANFDLIVSPHRYHLFQWEASHFLEKWVNKASELMPWTSESSREERIEQAETFFDLGLRQGDLERRLLREDFGQGGGASNAEVQDLRDELDTIVEQRDRLQATVEETIESEISAVLSQEGFASRIGLIFPPVDAVFSRSPGVLVLSPRDRIERSRTVLLKAGLDDETKEQIETRILLEEDLSALVERSGGVATYPSVVSDAGGLHRAMVIAAHEWLHHWFFFQPLGQHFWDSQEMTTLNETAATLAGEAIGDRAFTAMTGEPVFREPARPPVSESLQPTPVDEDAFDFNAAMRETRLRTEELLAQGKVEEAEAYMEERRQLMADNGRFIRKINQAFFAFHGTYATSAASISPIDEQLRLLQSSTDSLEEFIKTVGEFASYQEFLDHLAELPAAVARR